MRSFHLSACLCALLAGCVSEKSVAITVTLDFQGCPVPENERKVDLFVIQPGRACTVARSEGDESPVVRLVTQAELEGEVVALALVYAGTPTDGGWPDCGPQCWGDTGPMDDLWSGKDVWMGKDLWPDQYYPPADAAPAASPGNPAQSIYAASQCVRCFGGTRIALDAGREHALTLEGMSNCQVPKALLAQLKLSLETFPPPPCAS